MNDPVTIIIPGNPVGKARPRFTAKGNTYTPHKTRVYERDVGIFARAEMGAREPMLGPVQMTFRAVFAIPESWTMRKKQDALIGRLRPTSKPDIDNVIKAAGDALNGIVYRDDSQIVEITGSKRYGERAMLVVTVKPIIGTITDHISEAQQENAA